VLAPGTSRGSSRPSAHVYREHGLGVGVEAFDLPLGRGSEPDLVIETEVAHIWVEAKFGSTNSTTPSDVEGAAARYTTGGGDWYTTTVSSPFKTIAVQHRRYELLRLWLLGSWAAAQHDKRFELVNLVRQGLEEDIPSFAAEHFKLTPSCRVHRVTWESLHAFISGAAGRTADDDTLLEYMNEQRPSATALEADSFARSRSNDRALAPFVWAQVQRLSPARSPRRSNEVRRRERSRSAAAAAASFDPPEVEVVIEVPRGSSLKRGSTGRIDFVSPLPCQFNYGAVPTYLWLEGDRYLWASPAARRRAAKGATSITSASVSRGRSTAPQSGPGSQTMEPSPARRPRATVVMVRGRRSMCQTPKAMSSN
jgi:hypothetical protein